MKYLVDDKPSCRFANLGEWPSKQFPAAQSSATVVDLQQQPPTMEEIYPSGYYGNLDTSQAVWSGTSLYALVEGLPSWRLCGR